MVVKGKLGLYGVLSILVALLMAFPVFKIGSGDSVEAGTVAVPGDIVHQTYDLSSLNIEQNIFGSTTGQYMGYSMISEDMNGDGIDDLVLSSPQYSSGRGVVFMFFGPSKDRVLVREDASVSIYGEIANGRLGLNLKTGDVDGDGSTDLLVTGYQDAYLFQQGASLALSATEAYLFLGASGWNNTMYASEADVIFRGRTGYALGFTAAIGDIDNDGLDDIVMGSMFTSATVYNGEVFIWKGRSTFESVYEVELEQYDHWIYNSNKTVYLGKIYNGLGISSLDLGDLNGDDYVDIMLGSSHMFTTNPFAGEVEVIYGGRNMLKDMDLELTSYLRIESFANYRLSLATHADIDGDGYEDLLVTAPSAFYDRTGGIFVFHGRWDLGTGVRSIFDYEFLIRGPRSNFEFGVMSMGDLDKDGRDDLSIYSLMGADYNNRGSYYILYMKETDSLSDPTVYNMKFNSPSTVIKGPSGAVRFSHYLKPNLLMMDFDSDGLTDIVASDFQGSGAGYQSNAGVVFFIYQIETQIKLNYFDLLEGDGEDGSVLGAGKIYRFEGKVENTWSLDDFRKIDIIFQLHGGDLEGQSIALYWDRGLMIARIKSDPGEYLTIVSSSFNPDGHIGMNIYLNISFKPTIPTEEYIDFLMQVEAGKGLSVMLSKPKLFRVECDVEFLGDLKVLAAINGQIASGEFVQAVEQIEVMGVRVVYENTEASPPNSYYSVRMTDNYGNVFLNSTTSGRDIYFTYATQKIAGREEIRIDIVDLIAEADDISGGLSFYYVVDTDVPEPPYDLEVRADSDIDTLMGYDDDPNVWVMWAPADDLTSNVIGYLYNTYDAGSTGDGTFIERTKFEFKGLMPGWNTIYIWSVDQALNYGPAASISVYYDTQGPRFLQPTPSPGSWVNVNDVMYEISLVDDGGSGVQGRSIEYSISNDGGRTYGAWEPTNIKRVGDQISVKMVINFREGQDNYVVWRAKDVAGNGYIESTPYQLKVDTQPLTYKDAEPELPQDSSYVTCGITLDDARGSGVDASAIQYSVSLNGVSNYGPWERLDISGSYETIAVQTPPLYFNRDTVNYIKWRAKDVAGNGWTYSDDIPVEVTEVRRNANPVPIISSPVKGDDYDTTSIIEFDGSTSEDANSDNLTYLWISDLDGYLGTDPVLYKQLSAGTHLITLAVSDGKSNVTISQVLKVFLSIPNIDTDDDGISDVMDTDDDGDGLLDIEEDRNRNGFLDLELNETNPKDPDTDKDGAMDGEDYSPLDPNVWKKPTSDMISGFVVWFIIILIIILLLVVAFIFILKQRTDREKTKVKMDLRRTKRNLRRFEVLTGVPTNDLPAIEAVQWALPGVIAEASEFILEAPPTDDLLPPSQEDDGKAPEPEMKVSRPEIQDMEAPIVPTITEKPSGPEPPKAAAKQGGKVISCSLCGSEVPVAEGATSVECPLCGELIKV